MGERKQLGMRPSARQTKLAIHNSNIILNSSTSRKRKNDENSNPGKPITRDSIYEDPPTPASKRSRLANIADCAVQTDLPCCTCSPPSSQAPQELSPTNASGSKSSKATDVRPEKPKHNAQDVLSMLTSDEPGERYWEMVASERKVALVASLSENKQLHEHNTQLQQELHTLGTRVEVLQKDNAMLEDMLAEARKLAELVEAATEDDTLEEEDARPLQSPAGSNQEAQQNGAPYQRNEPVS